MGGSKKTTKTKRTTKNLLPAYMRQASVSAVQIARDRTNQEYEAYGDQRIADVSRNEQLGIRMARDNANVGQQDFASARESLQGIGSFADEGVAEQYMNPYIEQVVQPGLRRKNEAFEAERAQRQANRGMTGAFGGRGNMWENKFESDFQRDQDEYMGGAYGAAYESAAALQGREQDRAINQAAAYTNLAQTRSSESRNRIADLMASGLVERTQEQADKDFKYIEFLEDRDWDINNLSTLVQTLGSIPYESTQKVNEKVTEETKPDAMKIVAGVALIAAGVMTGGTALAAFGPALASGGAGLLGGSGGGG